MQIINIDNNNAMDRKPHCIVCGSSSSDNGDMKECKHLVYISSSEMDTEPIYDKNNLLDKYNDVGDDEITMFEYLTDNLNDNYVCITINDPVPVPGDWYCIYNISK